jgi:hypothetical protein
MAALTSTRTALRRALIDTIHQSSRRQHSVALGALKPVESCHLLLSSSSSTTRTRTYASTTRGGPTNSSSSNNNAVPPPSASASSSYASPFQEIFDTIKEGKTFLGTTEFQVPNVKFLKCGVPEHVLRFKTTTYGRLLEEPFVRPMEHRVTLQVPVRHIPLSDSELLVLKEIVGTRYNEETGVLQLSSSQFGSRIENKRHVVSMLERIVDSAKTLAERVEKEVRAMEA